ncbi:MAG: hypothetical protein BWK77_05555 [Verrucomicrobia bacterium A1]|nr:MAG: hypothetical protein BWK77_05555 [Verrucomicrobia bacterium A1]
MARIHDDDLRRLKENVSLTDLCRSRGIELKKHGSRDLIGKCPFHQDENPSFVVTPTKNLFHCLGCDAAGSVIDFVMKLDGLDFRAAVDKLLPGLSGVEGGSTPKIKRAAEAVQEKKIEVAPERANQLLERVVSISEKNFDDPAGSGTSGRAYLEKRGITDAGLFTQHRIGFSNGRLKEVLPSAGPVWDELEALGVILTGGNERFAGCVVFPVFDADGNLTTLYGRFTGPEPKRHVFLPDRSTGLWNAPAMKTYSEIILVESVIDALSVMVAGYRNVIAIQGTNGLNEAEIAALRDHGVQSIVLLLDGDEAGRKAAERLKEKLSSFSRRVLTLPDDHDPNSFLQARGAMKLAEFVNQTAESGAETPTVRAGGGDGRTPPDSLEGTAKPQVPPGLLQPGGTCFRVAYGLRRYEIRGLEKASRKLRATVRLEHAGKLHVDTLDFYSARGRAQLAQDLCRLFDETPETIEADLQRLIVECERHKPGEPGAALKPELQLSAKEKAEAEAFGRSPDLIERILADFENGGLIGEESNKVLGYLAMTSRKRDEPLSVLTLSSSGAGKTALQDAVLSFCPPEDLVKLTALSGKALFYKEQLSLKHKVLALEEGDGAQEASYAIRNLISAGVLVSETTIKDLATGRLVTMESRVEGPTSVFLTTTNPEIDAETKSRFFVTSIDESRDQTRKILAFQRARHLSDGPAEDAQREAILQRHRNFQRLLKPLAVKNPFAGQLTYGDDRLQGRRDQPKYLNLIKAVAFLRQMQKETRLEANNGTAAEFIEVDLDDLALANRLAHEILGHSLDELSRPGHDLLLALDEMVKARLKERHADERKPRVADLPALPSGREQTGVLFSRREVREFTGWTNTRLHIHLKELADFEYLAVDAGRNGLPFRYRLAWDGQGHDGKRFVPGLSSVEGLGLKDAKDLRPPKG